MAVKSDFHHLLKILFWLFNLKSPSAQNSQAWGRSYTVGQNSLPAAPSVKSGKLHQQTGNTHTHTHEYCTFFKIKKTSTLCSNKYYIIWKSQSEPRIKHAWKIHRLSFDFDNKGQRFYRNLFTWDSSSVTSRFSLFRCLFTKVMSDWKHIQIIIKYYNMTANTCKS